MMTKQELACSNTDPNLFAPCPAPRLAPPLRQTDGSFRPATRAPIRWWPNAAAAARITDVDGNEFLDFCGGHRRELQRATATLRLSPRSKSRLQS